MVADKREPASLDYLVDAPLRISAVTDHVAETQRFIHRRAVAQHGFECLPVRVNVGKKRDPQAGLS